MNVKKVPDLKIYYQQLKSTAYSLQHTILAVSTFPRGLRARSGYNSVYHQIRSMMCAANGEKTSCNGSPVAQDTAADKMAGSAQTSKKLHGREFYESLGSPKFVLAPMVSQSEFVRRARSLS